MSERREYCTEMCPLYSSDVGCLYKKAKEGGDPEPVSAGERCLHPDFDSIAYIKMYSLGVVDKIDPKKID